MNEPTKREPTPAEQMIFLRGQIAMIEGKIKSCIECNDRSVILAWPQYGLGLRMHGAEGTSVTDILNADKVPADFRDTVTNGKGERAVRVERRFAAYVCLSQLRASLDVLVKALDRMEAAQ